MGYITAYFLIITGLLFSVLGYSQTEIEVINLNFAQYPQTEFKNGNSGELKTSVSFFTANVNIPVFRLKNGIIFNGLTYDFLNIGNTDISNNYPFLRDISTVGYNIKWLQKFNKTALFVNGEIRYSTDKFSGLNADKTVFREAVGLIKIFNSTKIKSLGLGIGSSTDYGSPTVVPVLFLTGSFSEKINYQAILPFKSKLSYAITPKMDTGFQHFARFLSYSLADNQTVSFGKTRNISVGLFVERKLYNHFYLMLNNGVYLRNSFLLFDKEKNFTDEYAAKTNYFFNLKLSFKINRNEANF